MSNRRGRGFGIALAALVVAGGAWMAARQVGALRAAKVAASSTAASEPQSDPVADERDMLRGELRRLGAENAALRSQRAAAAEGAAAAARAPREPAGPPPSPETEARWLMARAEMLDEVLAKQPRDEAWATAHETHARAVAAGQGSLGVTLVGSSCRSSACRFEYSYVDEDARLKHIQTLGRDFGDLPHVSYAYPGEPDSHTRAIMFLAQDGHELPGLPFDEFLADAR